MTSLSETSTLSTSATDLQLFGRSVDIVQPTEIRQYLHCLRPGCSVKDDFRTLRGESNIGKLDLLWRTSFGDRGRLQTSQLLRMVKNRSKF